MKPSACPRLFEVEALRDGRLTGPERSHFEHHLAACPACSREARALDQLARALRSIPEPRGDELHDRRERTRLLAEFDRALVGERRGARGRRWLALVAAAALAAGVCFFWRASPLPLDSPPPGPAASSAEFRADAGALWSRQVEARRELVVLERGALWIRVAAVPNKLPLRVQLPDGELEDIGTTFTVSVEAGRTTRVAVDEGRVVLRLRQRAPVVIAAGESWPASAIPSSPAPPSALAPESSPPQPSVAPAATSAQADGATPRREPTATQREPAPARPPPSTRKPPRPRATRSLEPAPRDAAHDFREAMAALHAGQSRDAADRFARFSQEHPRDARAEDAAYMRVLALREAGDEAGMNAAAGAYLRRYPQGFRRTEVEGLLR
jgi:anti-sigma factor RsiW/TolA-binding protein